MAAASSAQIPINSKTSGITKHQGIVRPPKEHGKLPGTLPKEMGTHELANKEFKIIVPKMLRELQENTDKTT